jgi:hypothetical protein
VAGLISSKQITLKNGKQIKFADIDFTILLPSDLSDNMFKKISAKRLSENWQTIKVDAENYRPYDFSMDMKKSRRGKLYLCDIPITLNSLNEAITLYSQKTHIGKSEIQTLLENKEIGVFKRVLDYLIEHDSITRGRVKTEIVNI